MAKQTRLEKDALELRKEMTSKNSFNKNNEYNENNPKTLSGNGGKGTGISMTYSVPNPEASRTAMAYNVNTEGGGSKIDIEKYQEAMRINIYDNENQYGINAIDTEIARAEGQYSVR